VSLEATRRIHAGDRTYLVDVRQCPAGFFAVDVFESFDGDDCRFIETKYCPTRIDAYQAFEFVAGLLAMRRSL